MKSLTEHSIIFLLVLGLFASSSLSETPPSKAPEPKIVVAMTQIRANAEMSGVDCGGGLTTYKGTHGATIISLIPAHNERTWTLRGEMHKCGTIFFSQLSSCEIAGVAKYTPSLTCNTQRDFPCELEVKGKSVGSMFLVTSDTAWGYCFSRHCDPSS